MSFLRATGSQWRPPQIGKTFIVSSWRGITRIQRWPKKRGTKVGTAQWKRQERFRLMQLLIKHLHPREYEVEREALKNHNRTHRGQRGSAAIRLRDWQMQRLYGRTLCIDTPIGITFYPWAVSRDASLILDWCTDQPGEILQRTAQTWEAIAPGQPGQVLTSNGPLQANSWQDL